MQSSLTRTARWVLLTAAGMLAAWAFAGALAAAEAEAPAAGASAPAPAVSAPAPAVSAPVATPGDAPAPAAEKRMSLRDFIRAGRIVGYVIIFLSFAGFALVIDAFLRIRQDKLLPERLAAELVNLARQGRAADMQNMCLTVDCLLSRIVRDTFAQGRMSLAAARDVMQEQGTKEVTRLVQHVGYIGFIAAVAPMLGLLGTVTGMIDSFGVLGAAKGAAQPDELAVGVSEALVTTCMGLVVALPLMFFHNYFRDRVTRIGQEAAGICDRLIRGLADAQAPRLAAEPPAAAPREGRP
jgi:biopolymer transport protein ExbB